MSDYTMGKADGYDGRRQANSANAQYQRGYRKGAAEKVGFKIFRSSIWLGNGFGVEARHTATVGPRIVGEFRSGSPSNWAFEQRGAAVMTYKNWRKALEAGRAD